MPEPSPPTNPPPPTPPEDVNKDSRYVRDTWDADEWGHLYPGGCLRKVG